MQQTIKKGKVFSTNTMTKVAILSAISYILMFIAVPIPGIFPDFLKIDISDLPAIFGGLSLGPVAGFAIVLIKNLFQAMTASTTAWIGEFANLLIGGSYVIIVSLIYRQKRNLKGLIMGFVLGTIAMILVGCLTNYYMLLPFYGKIMPMEAIINMGNTINPNVTDLKTFVIWMIAPFNLFKAVLISLITLPLYKKMEVLLKK
ncbi:ECF transporter S component [Paraclostridium sordellii]|uniref:Riboflavin transporter n=1 Tax=Paraclostridium sordellii TaxID=1505 RepID=A0A0C7QPA2_PARSO|nr:ECF transporter S component [Paeniclostridium sordellii]QYE97901.1 ECF transporter S component [Paeniclostridium sordellii]CEN80396.1 riboflavin transporter [[Clostridium] sordellii] [Paeniclostridium sordellii]CEO14506.1 riboflavin transporter [[Clostridium] sordellii] [Paeniclostridium sordellii]CEP89735.1 riboflavin transporter [[Clostridium] sordellii] [Paeniclostridium sordellii]CEP98275.1 riboflavin transporter [[Clostridium] sordellii] [Paeniclostridium sordellii]